MPFCCRISASLSRLLVMLRILSVPLEPYRVSANTVTVPSEVKSVASQNGIHLWLAEEPRSAVEKEMSALGCATL